MHEGYYTDVQDLALLKLAEDLVWNDYVRPVCLPTSDVAGGTVCWITGWGDVFAATADMYVGIANQRFPLKSVARKTFPAFPVHTQPAILRIW